MTLYLRVMLITALHNALIISDGQIIPGKAVLFSEGKITGVVSDSDVPTDAEKIDLKGAFLAPGLIDLQLYGSGGRLLSIDTDEATLLQMENDLLDQGTMIFTKCINNTFIIYKSFILC